MKSAQHFEGEHGRREWGGNCCTSVSENQNKAAQRLGWVFTRNPCAFAVNLSEQVVMEVVSLERLYRVFER